MIVNWFIQFAEQREKEFEKMVAASGGNPNNNSITNFPVRDYIILASCSVGEILPQSPSLPADVFTSCLTSPIKMAIRWFCSNSTLSKKEINLDIADKIPGKLSERKTPIGELNWIFTAITDTIAWNTFPRGKR
jgi:regulator-associated protein of mTOR